LFWAGQGRTVSQRRDRPTGSATLSFYFSITKSTIWLSIEPTGAPALGFATGRGPVGRRALSKEFLLYRDEGEPAIARFDRALSPAPPMEKPKPGAPRVLGSRIELYADLRDRVLLHVAHDQFHGAKARPVSDGRSAVEPARQKLG
jgi:hypothetical protein